MTNPFIGRHRRSEYGLTVVEVLVSLSLVVLLGAGVTKTMVMVIGENARDTFRTQAMQLALDRLEAMSMTEPSTLLPASDSTETLTINGHTFIRTTSVIIQASRARRVTVSVRPNASRLNFIITMSNSFGMWGKR